MGLDGAVPLWLPPQSLSRFEQHHVGVVLDAVDKALVGDVAVLFDIILVTRVGQCGSLAWGAREASRVFALEVMKPQGQ